MKKGWKILITSLVVFILYVLLYIFFVNNAAPENFVKNTWTFYVSVFGCLVGIPVAIVLRKFVKTEKNSQNIILIAAALVWGFLFGWLSLGGMAIGEVIAEPSHK